MDGLWQPVARRSCWRTRTRHPVDRGLARRLGCARLREPRLGRDQEHRADGVRGLVRATIVVFGGLKIGDALCAPEVK